MSAARPTIGVIGLGIMGKPMARNLIKAGYSLVVHNRSRGPVEELAGEGAATADSPRAVAERLIDVALGLTTNVERRHALAEVALELSLRGLGGRYRLNQTRHPGRAEARPSS